MKNNLILNYLNKNYPKSLKDEWDQVGKIVYFNSDVDKVLITLEVNNETIKLAKKNKIKLIISHHPIFLDSLNENKNEKQYINELKKNKITLFSIHTNFDNAPLGMKKAFSNRLPKTYKPVNSTDCISSIKLTKKLYIEQIIKDIKENFNFSYFNFLPELSKKKISEIKVVCGSGFSILKQYINTKKWTNETLFITSDLKWHNWQFIKNNKLNFLEISHDIENIFIDYIADQLKNNFKNLKLYKQYYDLYLIDKI